MTADDFHGSSVRRSQTAATMETGKPSTVLVQNALGQDAEHVLAGSGPSALQLLDFRGTSSGKLSPPLPQETERWFPQA